MTWHDLLESGRNFLSEHCNRETKPLNAAMVLKPTWTSGPTRQTCASDFRRISKRRLRYARISSLDQIRAIAHVMFFEYGNRYKTAAHRIRFWTYLISFPDSLTYRTNVEGIIWQSLKRSLDSFVSYLPCQCDDFSPKIAPFPLTTSQVVTPSLRGRPGTPPQTRTHLASQEHLK